MLMTLSVIGRFISMIGRFILNVSRGTVFVASAVGAVTAGVISAVVHLSLADYHC
jgi:hypothetical protein